MMRGHNSCSSCCRGCACCRCFGTLSLGGRAFERSFVAHQEFNGWFHDGMFCGTVVPPALEVLILGMNIRVDERLIAFLHQKPCRLARVSASLSFAGGTRGAKFYKSWYSQQFPFYMHVTAKCWY